MRRPRITSEPSEFATHDHVAWRGDGPGAIGRIATEAFAAAVGRGDRLLFVAEDPDLSQLAGLPGIDELVDRGALHLASVEQTYRLPIDIDLQRDEFVSALRDALYDGYGGICVVADNSELALGSDAEFAAWLKWEATADRLQAAHPISGVCFYDAERVPEARLADLAVLHPVLSADFVVPSYQIYCDDGLVRVRGELDSFCVEQLQRILTSAPQLVDRVVDVAGVDFIDHGVLRALNQVGSEVGPLYLRGAKPIVRLVWELLDVPAPALEFC